MFLLIFLPNGLLLYLGLGQFPSPFYLYQHNHANLERQVVFGILMMSMIKENTFCQAMAKNTGFTPANRILPHHLLLTYHLNPSLKSPNRDQIKKDPQPSDKSFHPLPSLLAQTSTKPHTEAHRHRVRQSCAWSLETYQSCHEPRSKGLFFIIFPFPYLDFELLMGFSGFMGFFGAS